MEGNEAIITGRVVRGAKRFIDPSFGLDRVLIAVAIPMGQGRTCVADCVAQTESMRDVALELQSNDEVEIRGHLVWRSRKTGNGTRQPITEIIIEGLAILNVNTSDQGHQTSTHRASVSGSAPLNRSPWSE